MFLERDYDVVMEPSDADFICFTGGADVCPIMYGHSLHPATHYDVHRDVSCVNLFNECRDKPKVGICRGAQFLNVMSGGVLYQHVNNHSISGTHEAYDPNTGEVYQVTSTHHQMMVLAEGWEGDVLLLASESSLKESPDNLTEIKWKNYEDVEVVWYEHTQSLCFQPHPEDVEYSHECQELFFTMLKEYM